MCALQLCSCTAVDTGVGERLSYGRFHEVRIYPPHPPVQHLALLLSGDGGWGSPLDAIASRLSDQGTLVAGIDVRDLFSSYARDPQSCVSPGAELAGLAHHLAQRYALPKTPPLPAPWSALPGARFIGLPGITHGYHRLNRWWPAFEAAWRQLAAPAPGVNAL